MIGQSSNLFSLLCLLFVFLDCGVIKEDRGAGDRAEGSFDIGGLFCVVEKFYARLTGLITHFIIRIILVSY